MKRVAIYCRLSDEDRDKRHSNDESESIQNQKSMLQEYCLQNGWDIYKIFCDEDYSGADRNRPQFSTMLHDCQNGLVDIVLCKTQSRFSRDMEIIEKYIHGKFVEWNVRFVSVVDHADTQMAGNKKARQINGLINEWYLEDLSDNIKKTLKHKKQNGEYTGSFAPFGYIIDPYNKNHLITDPVAAQVVKMIFQMYIEGLGYIKIAKELNNKQIPNPCAYKKQEGSTYRNFNFESRIESSLWTESSVYNIIRQETYMGTLVQGKSQSISCKSKKRHTLPEEQWIKCEGTHEAIVSKEIWHKAESMRAIRGRPDKLTGEMHLFSKKVYCAICKRSMWKMSYQLKNGRYEYLRCRTVKVSVNQCDNTSSIRLDALEALVLNEINVLLKLYYNPELIKFDIQHYAETADELLLSRNKLYELKKRKESFLVLAYEDKLSGVISCEQFDTINQKFFNEIKECDLRLKEIYAALRLTEKSKNPNCEDILNKYRQIDRLKKEFVDELIDNIHIGKKSANGKREIYINWSF